MACTFIYLQESVSTFTRTVVNTNKRKMHESEPVILIWSEILKEEDKEEEGKKSMMLFHQIILHNYRKHECSVFQH